ncbi:MAG TPA: slipin family protein, partial [Blastocatellia bacterium]|nr:slipin family protein [Blastocatellia bacterium]
NAIASEPVALQLRYLQTLTEIGVERNTTVVFPVPIDLLQGFLKREGRSDAVASKGREPVGAV